MNLTAPDMNSCFQGMVLTWDNYRLDTYVQKLADAVFNHQEKVTQIKLSYHDSF